MSKSRAEKREAAQEENEYVELQGESLLDSKTAAQDFIHAALVRRNLNENSFHILKRGILLRKGQEQNSRTLASRNQGVQEEHREEADTALCYPENTMLP